VPKNALNPNMRAAPTYALPTENQWYKAAYYAPQKGGAAVPGYWPYATQSDAAPGNLPPDQAVSPSANYIVGFDYCVTQSSVLDRSRNYLTDVGAFADSGSHFGTLDQNGNLYQWNDLNGAAGLNRGLRGGFWAGGVVTLRSTTFTQVNAVREANDAGFRLVGPATFRAKSVAAADGTGIDRAVFAAAGGIRGERSGVRETDAAAVRSVTGARTPALEAATASHDASPFTPAGARGLACRAEPRYDRGETDCFTAPSAFRTAESRGKTGSAEPAARHGSADTRSRHDPCRVPRGCICPTPPRENPLPHLPEKRRAVPGGWR
jgi:hypothetical protein